MSEYHAADPHGDAQQMKKERDFDRFGHDLFFQ
jgi:hypothetical protein